MSVVAGDDNKFAISSTEERDMVILLLNKSEIGGKTVAIVEEVGVELIECIIE